MGLSLPISPMERKNVPSRKNRINCYLKKFLKIYKKIAIIWVVIIDLKQDFCTITRYVLINFIDIYQKE